jgi:energy-coupling factor transporter ATP-binding protein EcfA2
VWEEISGGNDMLLGKREMNSRAYTSAFNFKGPDQQQKVGNLSGGQRNRVHLAKMLKSGANVLLLDEPTNDLDTETLAALEEALEDFAGCAVIISHDRMFLDRLATHMLAFEGDSHVEWFEGNFQDYEADKKRRLGKSIPLPPTLPHNVHRKHGTRTCRDRTTTSSPGPPCCCSSCSFCRLPVSHSGSPRKAAPVDDLLLHSFLRSEHVMLIVLERHCLKHQHARCAARSRRI